METNELIKKIAPMKRQCLVAILMVLCLYLSTRNFSNFLTIVFLVLFLGLLRYLIMLTRAYVALIKDNFELYEDVIEGKAGITVFLKDISDMGFTCIKGIKEGDKVIVCATGSEYFVVGRENE